MKRIGVYSPTWGRGGSEENLIALARSLRSRGFDVYAAMPDVEGLRTVRDDLLASGIEVDAFPDTPAYDPRYSPADYVETHGHVVAQLRRRTPDGLFLLLPEPRLGAALIDAAAHCDVPIAVMFQLVAHVFDFSNRERRVYTWARRQRQVWATVSSANRELLRESLGWAADAIEVVQNGVLSPPAAGATARALARTAVRRELGVDDDAVLALTAARLHTAQKAHDVTIDAAMHVVARHPHTHFVWLGEGPDEAGLRDAIRARGLDRHVHMLGHRTDVHKFMVGCDLFVLPSRYEGMPLSLLEALHAGMPVVCSSIAPHREVFDGAERAAVLVTPDDREALAAALERVIAAPDLRASMGAAALERARTFTWEASFERALEVLMRAGDHPARPDWPLPEEQMQRRRRIAIYGAGEAGRHVFANALLPYEHVVAFLDRDRGGRGEELFGCPILAPSAAPALDVDTIIVASSHYKAIGETLSAMGLPGDRVEFVDLHRLIDSSADAISARMASKG